MANPKIDNSIVGNRSNISLDCNWTGSADFGRIVPFHVEELVGTDRVTHCVPKVELQMLSLASPTFGKIDAYIHYFFVPHRLCFPAFDDVMSQKGTRKGEPFPYVTRRDLTRFYQNLPVADQRGVFKHWTSLGLPPFFESGAPDEDAPENYKISLLKFRAYNQIWWDFFRDPEVLPDENKDNFIFTDSGRFEPNAYLPSVRQLQPWNRTLTSNWIANLFASPGGSPSDFYTGLIDDGTGNIDTSPTGHQPLSGDEVSDASRRLRTIEALTRLSERLSLSGKREIEQLFARYGIKPDFQKLQMCEYVGGCKETININTITSSANTLTGEEAAAITNGSPLGAKSGEGYANFANININYEAKEPGYLIGVISIMPHVHFVQGIDKSWLRNDINDFFQKHLEYVGQVAVAKSEVAVSDGLRSLRDGQDVETFAFSQPFYEYKQGRDILAGDFMKYHNVEDYDTMGDLLPDLAYMQSMEMYADYPEDRIFNADNLQINASPYNKVFFYQGGNISENVDDHFLLCIDKEVTINRPMEGYAIPTLETTQEPHRATTELPHDTVL